MEVQLNYQISDNDIIAMQGDYIPKGGFRWLASKGNGEFLGVFDTLEEIRAHLKNGEYVYEVDRTRMNGKRRGKDGEVNGTFSIERQFIEDFLYEHDDVIPLEHLPEPVIRSDDLIIQSGTFYGQSDGIWQNGKILVGRETMSHKTFNPYKWCRKHMERTGIYPQIYRVRAYGGSERIDMVDDNGAVLKSW